MSKPASPSKQALRARRRREFERARATQRSRPVANPLAVPSVPSAGEIAAQSLREHAGGPPAEESRGGSPRVESAPVNEAKVLEPVDEPVPDEPVPDEPVPDEPVDEPVLDEPQVLDADVAEPQVDEDHPDDDLRPAAVIAWFDRETRQDDDVPPAATAIAAATTPASAATSTVAATIVATEPRDVHTSWRRTAVLLVAVVALLAIGSVASYRLLRSDDPPAAAATVAAAPTPRAPATPTVTPPPAAPANGAYVHTTILPNGDQVVSQWVRRDVPMADIVLRAPRPAGLTARPLATGVTVTADGVRVVGSTEVAQEGRRYDFDEPARAVNIRYLLRNTVDRDSTVKGRALARLTSLAVDFGEQPGETKVDVIGTRVLSTACVAPDKPKDVPRSCGEPVPAGWQVLLDGKARDDAVMAQVDLS